MRVKHHPLSIRERENNGLDKMGVQDSAIAQSRRGLSLANGKSHRGRQQGDVLFVKLVTQASHRGVKKSVGTGLILRHKAG
jgi:hypothetical protein